MRSVIYASDFEPITIVDLPPWAYAYLEKHGRVVLPVMAPPIERPLRLGESFDPQAVGAWKVRINAVPFRFFDTRHLLLYTADEETALLLKSVFLPGQQRAMREKERRAFAGGIQAAFDMLGKLNG